MPQLDFFIFFDSAVTAGLVFSVVHILVVFYLLPIWLRTRVFGRVLTIHSQVGVALCVLRKQYRK
jgi:hypothetical protein